MAQLSKRLISACLTFSALASLGIDAAADTRKTALAVELADLIQVRRVASEYITRCGVEGTYLDPKRIFDVEPGYFSGISPQSAYWPEVVALYRRYQSTVCSAVTADEYARVFAEQYAQNLSEGELEATVSFFSSATGRRYVSVSSEANFAMLTYMNREMKSAMERAFKEAQQEVQAIVLRYRKDPK